MLSVGVLRGNLNDRRDMSVLFILKLPESSPLPSDPAPEPPSVRKVLKALKHMAWIDCMNTIRLIKKLPIEVVEVDDDKSSTKKQLGYLRQLPSAKKVGETYERDDEVWIHWKSEWRDQLHELKEHFKEVCEISFDQYVFNIRENLYE